MDPRLLKYYNQELQYMREMGGEFARAYPKIAGRLTLDEFDCADPYVERLLEGFSFLTARIQLKLDEEFPRFTQHMLERVYPHYVCPTPSMALVEFEPDFQELSLAEGFVLPRHSVLRTRGAHETPTACIYRTAHEVTLWPLRLQSADYLPSPAAISLSGIGRQEKVRAAIRLRFTSQGGVAIDGLPLERLALQIVGGGAAAPIFEAIAGHTLNIVGRAPSADSYLATSSPEPVRVLGFDSEESLLPYGPQSFQGYRYLAEYFTLPERYMFVELRALQPLVRQCQGNELELTLMLDQAFPELEDHLDESHFRLYSTPVVNLFPKQTDRIHLKEGESEHHVLPDRSRPLDYEVYTLTEVKAFSGSNEKSQPFAPFYEVRDLTVEEAPMAYYALDRRPRVVSSKQQREGKRSGYIGSEVFIAIVDADASPYRRELRQLSVKTLCSNRDLPLLIPLGKESSVFSLEDSAPVNQIRSIGTPTRPRPPAAGGELSWRLINHLTLNHFSLADEDEARSTAALKELLLLYAADSELSLRKQIDGLVSVRSRPVNRRMPSPGPIAFGRGLEITLTLDESAFQGVGAFLFGAVMEQFFRKYVAINAFTETILASVQRGVIMRWPARLGMRHIL
jgi:type VI secretion system protein ImpG